MKRRTWVCAFLLLLSAAGVAQTKAADAAAAVQAMEDKWTEAARKNDVAALDSLLADQAVFTSMTGQVRNKAAFLAEMKTRKYESAGSSETKVTVFGDTAIATGLWKAKGTDKGKPFDELERYTDTWVKIAGQWKCVASHGSAPKPAK
jgi:ketosteroid isomerase-like protein